MSKSKKSKKSTTSKTKAPVQGSSTMGGVDDVQGSSSGGIDTQEAVESLRIEHDYELASASRITVVIPYKASPAKGKELLFALRAWDKFLPNCRVIIIGDDPGPSIRTTDSPFGDDGVIHLEHTPTSPNPQIDVAQKLLLACDSHLVDDHFILSNDDIYPVCPITITDIDMHVAMGRLGVRGAAGSMYRSNSANTLNALQKEGIKSPFDYATHTPSVFWKKELKEIILRFKATEVGHLVGTLYFNVVWKDHRPIIVDNGINDKHVGSKQYVASVFKSGTKPELIRRVFAERKFINNNDSGWDGVLPFLRKTFPDKSRFES